MDYGIKGKVAVVTGAGQGIGKAIAVCLAKEGVNICICDIQEDTGFATSEEMKQYGVDSIFVKVDVSNEASVKNMFKTVKEKLGTVDILINNAGISPKKYDFDEIPYEAFKQTVDVNLIGEYLCSKYAYEQMKGKGWGRIVNMASFAGLFGGVYAGVDYASSKGGVVTMTKTLARRMGPDGITVNSVAPGRIDSAMTASADPEMVERTKKSIPLGRTGTPEEVGFVVCFLASEPARYVTGECIQIGGGWMGA